MKKFRSLIALLLALLTLPMCLFACNKGSGDAESENPDDTTDGIAVTIVVNGLVSSDGTDNPFLKTRDNEVFRVAPGTTLQDALTALCAAREEASYTLENTGRFSTFTFGSDKLEAKAEKQSDDTYIDYYFETTVNGTALVKEEAASYVINHKDVIKITLTKGTPYTP